MSSQRLSAKRLHEMGEDRLRNFQPAFRGVLLLRESTSQAEVGISYRGTTFGKRVASRGCRNREARVYCNCTAHWLYLSDRFSHLTHSNSPKQRVREYWNASHSSSFKFKYQTLRVDSRFPIIMALASILNISFAQLQTTEITRP